MRIVIVGPGALGCLLAAHLAEAGREVLLLDHRRERAEFLNERGLRIEDDDRERRVRLPVAWRASDAAYGRIFILCVKAYHTRTAAEQLAPHIASEARVLTLQNGIGNVEILSEILGPQKVWGGATAQGATEMGMGQIRHGGRGETVFGPAAPGADADLLAEAAEIFNESGIPARVEEDVHPLIWSKLIVNVGINALTALTRLRNGQLLEHAGAEEIMAAAVREAEAAAEASGVQLPYEDALERVREVARLTAGNVASMLQDVLAKRRTEIDFINGEVARRAGELGLAAPVNATLAGLVKTIEETYGRGVQ